jgi:hypothetical protein
MLGRAGRSLADGSENGGYIGVGGNVAGIAAVANPDRIKGVIYTKRYKLQSWREIGSGRNDSRRNN